MIKQTKMHLFLFFSLALMGFNHVSLGVQRLSRPSSSPIASSLASSPEKDISVANVKELDKLFKQWDFDLKKTKSEGKAPRLYLAKLPKDMGRKKTSSNGKFVGVLLPHILKVNEQILQERGRLLDMQRRQKAGIQLLQAEKTWLHEKATEYRCKSPRIEALLFHIDIIPPSLALSQGLLETGGGTSMAAIHKNSTFGLMASKTSVAKFESLLANVKAYMMTLNRHAAYKAFRDIRAKMRANNQRLCSHTLAPGLMKYSVRKAAYIKDVQNLIRRLDLTSYDQVTLEHHRRLKP